MLSLLIAAAASVHQRKIDTCQANNVFNVKNFLMNYVENSRFSGISVSFSAELTSSVEKPYLEIQIVPEGERVPIIRYKDELCRPGLLVCPARFATMTYTTQFSMPSRAAAGEYLIKLIFREGNTKLACYTSPFHLADVQSVMQLLR